MDVPFLDFRTAFIVRDIELKNQIIWTWFFRGNFIHCPTNFEFVPSGLLAFPEAMLWPSVPQPLWTSFLSYGEHGEIKKIREEANIQGNGKMTKPGYKEEPSLKVSFSRHVTCVRMNSNIQIGKYVVMYYFLYGIGWHSNLDSFLQEKETLRRVIL